jgi:hypothetical protein
MWAPGTAGTSAWLAARVRVLRLRRGHAQTAGEVGLAQDPLAFPRIVVIEDVRGTGPPAGAYSADLDTDAGIGLDVPHPVGVAPALGDQPERLALQAVTHGRAPRKVGTPAGRLQEGVAWNRDSQVPRQPDDRIDHRLLEAAENALRGS